jgi:hypothetical protein
MCCKFRFDLSTQIIRDRFYQISLNLTMARGFLNQDSYMRDGNFVFSYAILYYIIFILNVENAFDSNKLKQSKKI